MTKYSRYYHPGATWFFTVNLSELRGNRLLTDQIDLLREAFVNIKTEHPYKIDAVVIFPVHLHCILTLPNSDSDFSTQWKLIKAYFSRNNENSERISTSRIKRGERDLWQRRSWEYLIHDETGYRQHIDYIHWNQAKYD